MNKELMTFVVGETIYHVYALPRTGETWIDKAVVTKVGTTMLDEKVPSMYVRYKNYETDISLRDGNVVPNTYNCHRIFKSLSLAEYYSKSPSQWRPLGIPKELWEKSKREEHLKQDTFFNTMEF